MTVLIFRCGERALYLGHAGLGHHRAISGGDISLDLPDTQMPADSGDLRSAKLPSADHAPRSRPNRSEKCGSGFTWNISDRRVGY